MAADRILTDDTKRIYWWDNIKFVMIVLVVAGHFADTLVAHSGVMKSFYLFIYAFHMPVFLFISGMFYTNRFDKIGLFLPAYLYGKNYKKGRFAPYVNPENPDIVTALPPCILITSHNDNLKKYTLDFERALLDNDMPHEILCFPPDKRLTHAFSVFRPDLKESMDTIKEIHNYFEGHR